MPKAIEKPCTVCGDLLDPLMASLGMSTHPNCGLPEPPPKPATLFDDSAASTGHVPLADLAADLQAELTTMIRLHEETSPRSLQVALGPSDLGTECDRQLAYKVAGVRGFNVGDPLPAFVGSSLHSRIEAVIRADPHSGWNIEQRVQITPQIAGSADLVRPPLVLDIKSGGKDVIDRARKEGPSRKYLTQINLYAYGLNRTGVKIDQVALAYVPRSGWLKDMYVWAAPYDPTVAQLALKRVYDMARKLLDMNIRTNPHLWESIPATPGFGCQWCSLFNKEMGPNEPATDKMCAGWNIKRGEKQ